MKESIKQITKICVKHMREFSENNGINLKSTDAHELVAAFFGYNTRTSMLEDKKYPLSNLPMANLIVLIPSALINDRRCALEGLPSNLQESNLLGEEIFIRLAYEKFIVATKAWSYHDLKRQAILLAHEYRNHKKLYMLYFDPDHEDVAVERLDEGILITITPYYESIRGSEFKNVLTSILTTIWLKRIAGHIGFAEPEINTRSIPMLYKKQS